MSIREKYKPQVLMIDATVGNDYTLCLCENLNAEGIKVILVTTEDRNFYNKPDYEVKFWMPSKKLSKNKINKIFKYLTFELRLIIYATFHRKSIIHYQFFRSRFDPIGFFMIRIFHKRLVHTAHNVLPHEKKFIDYFLRALIYKLASVIIVHSKTIKKKLLNNFKIDDNKIFVVPHGDFDFFAHVNEDKELNARKELNLSSDDKVLLFFGIIREYKGLDMLLDAFDLVADKVESLRLLIAGSPLSIDLKETYEKKISKLKHHNKIIKNFSFIPIEEVPKYFKAADVVMLPYKAIDHSGIVHLAYSFGKPVIATRVGDFEEVIEHDKSGYILDTNDADNLSLWIGKAFLDINKLKEMGKYNLGLSKAKYSWRSVVEKTNAVYSKFYTKP